MYIRFSKIYWKEQDCLVWLYNNKYSSCCMTEDKDYYYYRQLFNNDFIKSFKESLGVSIYK